MGAWGREQGATGKVRMLGDGSGRYAKALGLELDLVERGLGVRVQRFSALVVRWRREDAERRGPGQVRGERRGDDAEAGRKRYLKSLLHFASRRGTGIA
jgi:hypothetical protein